MWEIKFILIILFIWFRRFTTNHRKRIIMRTFFLTELFNYLVVHLNFESYFNLCLNQKLHRYLVTYNRRTYGFPRIKSIPVMFIIWFRRVTYLLWVDLSQILVECDMNFCSLFLDYAVSLRRNKLNLRKFQVSPFFSSELLI